MVVPWALIKGGLPGDTCMYHSMTLQVHGVVDDVDVMGRVVTCNYSHSVVLSTGPTTAKITYSCLCSTE